MKTAGILLAAGKSTRFGDEDKLLADLKGRALVTYAAEALRGSKPDLLIAVARSAKVLSVLQDMEPARPDPEGTSLSASLGAGIAKARALGADRALIVLGDMPFITTDLLSAVVGKCTATEPSATSDGIVRLPPACFPACMFSELLAREGDRGASEMLASLPSESVVIAPPSQLKDIDERSELDALNGSYGQKPLVK